MSTWNERNQRIIEEFRANSGIVGGYFEGRTLLILHTTGAKSGKEHVVPLVTRPVGDSLVIAASKGGAPTHPDWYHNLRANPMVEVEFGPDRFHAKATINSDPKRAELYKLFVEYMPAFGDYENNTSRTIPVVTLTKVT